MSDLYLEIGSSDDKNKFTFCRIIAKISAYAEKVQEAHEIAMRVGVQELHFVPLNY